MALKLAPKEQSLLEKVAKPLKKSQAPANSLSSLQKHTIARKVNRAKPAVMMNDY